MTPEEFRESGHALIDWIADYRKTIAERPVRAQVKPGETRAKFSVDPPSDVVAFEQLIHELDHAVVPGVTQVQSPMHYGWFPSNASLSSVLGDIASSGIGALGISWESCPALTEVEEVTVDWMRQLVGLSEQWHGTIHDTASTACLTALMAAREHAGDFCLNDKGMQGLPEPLMVYYSEEAHSSVEKAALLAGFGRANLRIVEVDPATRSMQTDALVDAINSDLSAGNKPAAIVASIGSTGVTAFDPLKEIVAIAKQHEIWVHTDAAMAGTAMLLPECRHLWDGVEESDSISWNPHKWMGTILDTSLFFVREPEHLIRVMSTNPSYLQSTVDGAVTQYRDWGIPLGRRFRALKLWFQLSLDGVEAIRARLRRDLQNAAWLAGQVEQTEAWKLVSPVTLQTVCVRHEPEGLAGEALDAHTLRWVNAINQSGAAFMSPSKLNGSWMVRVSVGVESTEHHHVEKLWALMQKTAGDN
ncbi:MAG: pyridoxal-dependent decarboxylase [Pseudomonadota bacterium]